MKPKSYSSVTVRQLIHVNRKTALVPLGIVVDIVIAKLHGTVNILGKLIKRQGASKSTTEIDDISTALPNLAEKEVLPLCIGTSNMVMQTPSFNVHCEEANIGVVVDRMECLEESIDSFVEKNSAQIDLVSNNYEKIISNTNIENKRIDAIIDKLKTMEHNYCEYGTPMVAKFDSLFLVDAENI